MKNKLIFIVCLLSLFGCIKDNKTDKDSAGPANIRLSNASKFDFKDITVKIEKEVNYGDLDSHQVSEYKLFDKAYRFAYIKLTINGQIFTYQPVDYDGETPLSKGNYIYELNLNPDPSKKSLTIELIEEG